MSTPKRFVFVRSDDFSHIGPEMNETIDKIFASLRRIAELMADHNAEQEDQSNAQ